MERLKITAGTEVVAVAAGTAAGEIETRTQAREAIGTIEEAAREAIGTIGEAAIGTGTGGTGKIGTGTEEIGTIGIGEMSHLAAEGETTIAISTKTGESEGAREGAEEGVGGESGIRWRPRVCVCV